jgi:lipopolysaccharide transport system permease protein
MGKTSDLRVYTPSGLQDGSLFPRLFADLYGARDLALRLLRRDLNAQYRQSLLGYLWAFVPAVLVAVSFTLAGQASILNVPVTGVPYPVFALVGTVLWQTFAEAINGPLAALAASRPLLAKIRFPCEAVVLAKLGELCFNFLLKLVLVALVLVIFRVPVGREVLLAPFAVLALVMLGAALGLFLAPIAGLYEDVGRGLSVLLGLWFFLTPVIYQKVAPGSFLDWVNFLNPVTPLLVTARELLTSGRVSRPVEFLVVGGLTAPLLLLGLMFYRFGIAFSIERSGA